MENEVEHDWEYIGNHFFSAYGKYDRYEFRCRRCELSALCKGKKLNFIQVDHYKFYSWDKGRIGFVFGVGEGSLGRGGRLINNYFVGSPRNALEPACISQDDWDVFDVLI